MFAKFRNPIICIILLVVALLTAESNATSNATSNANLPSETQKVAHFKNFKVIYDADISSEIPERLAELESDFNRGVTGNVTLELRREADEYRMVVTISEAMTEPERQSAQSRARIATDLLSLDMPLSYQMIGLDNTEEVVHAMPPAGNLYAHQGDYVFCSENMVESEANAIFEGLRNLGHYNGNGRIARAVKSDVGYELSIPYSLEVLRSVPAYEQEMQAFADACKTMLFGGVTTELVACNQRFEPLAGMTWTAKGLKPGQQKLVLDNIVLMHDQEISEEVAMAVAERFPLHGVTEAQVWIVLSGSPIAMECTLISEESQSAPLMEFLGYFGREVLSAVEGCQSLKFMLGDFDDVAFATLDVQQNHGHYLAFHSNRLIYPKGTSPDRIERIRDSFQSMGLFVEDSEIVAKLSVLQVDGQDRYTLQMAFPKAANLDELKSELPGVGQVVADAAFQNEAFRLEFTDYDFTPNDSYCWHSSVEPAAE